MFRRGVFCFLACSLVAMRVMVSPSVAERRNARTTSVASFADVVFELEQAIVARGLTIHSIGNEFARMLERTGEAVGSTKAVYKDATFIEICSAKFARMMVEAEPDLMVNCPFVLFVYQTMARPSDVTVGFRRLAPAVTEAGRSAVAATEALLAQIVEDALK